MAKTILPRVFRYLWPSHLSHTVQLTSRQSGITHGFVAEFASVEDRDYYTKSDPAHQAFVKTLDKIVVKAIVVDFVNKQY